ncbi:methylated-DNA--protein-cysteine methyltransferase-like isoform X2 [Physella acuta]|nr:methylated-DNA--protein-cysteine methyltransferase-like isoform X2 [Physella acuta]XP_059151958.1 methylated-DNA--protein-cysteine methyltransferase-like isoform X2 [Physella acuta]XP_059151959.1 methylated-DNA--protein-cysteine methyltransferase-like isoform X2 [Physella acuta]
MPVEKMESCPFGGKIFQHIVSSPIGDIEIISCKNGLHSVFQCEVDDSNFSPDIKRPIVIKSDREVNLKVKDFDAANSCYLWLKDYFTQKIASTNIPKICNSVMKSDTFSGKALQLLPSSAPFGTTITYKDLAQLCGNAKASRAAGQAMSTNPISLLIPCHRVISSNGNPGNYAHGKKNKIKCWLLSFEKTT